MKEASTYLHIGHGAELTMKVGRINHISHLDNVKNIIKGVKGIVILFKELGLKKSNIRRIYLKTEKSESLPIYTQLSEEELQLAREILREDQ